MGIAGHILGPKKLRKLNRDFDMDFDRAYRYTRQGEARKIVQGRCRHFELDFLTSKAEIIEYDETMHWSSCFEDRGDWSFIGREEMESRLSPSNYPLRMTAPLFVAKVTSADTIDRVEILTSVTSSS